MANLYVAREAVVPMRGEPAESAEMISQLLFGEVVRLIEDQGNWYKIKLLSDGYEGWVNPRMLLEMEQDEYASYTNWQFVVEGNIMLDDDTHMRLPLGPRYLSKVDNQLLRWAGIGGVCLKVFGR